MAIPAQIKIDTRCYQVHAVSPELLILSAVPESSRRAASPELVGRRFRNKRTGKIAVLKHDRGWRVQLNYEGPRHHGATISEGTFKRDWELLD